MDRVHVISCGCLIWGAFTATIGVSTSVSQVRGCRSLVPTCLGEGRKRQLPSSLHHVSRPHVLTSASIASVWTVTECLQLRFP